MHAYFRESSEEANFPSFGSFFLITPILNLFKPPINGYATFTQ
jgi:hypothetical protein